MAAGASARPQLPDVDALQLSSSIDPAVLEELRAYNEEGEEEEEEGAAAAAAAAAEEEAALAAAGGRSKRKRTSRFIEVRTRARVGRAWPARAEPPAVH